MIDRIVLENVNMRALPDAVNQGEPSMLWNTRVEFRKGESYLLEAVSGRGKSSLCSFLCGLRSDYTGRISFFDGNGEYSAKDERAVVALRQRGIAMMFQEHRLFPELSAVDNVMLKSCLTGFADEGEVRGMLMRLGLGAHLDVPCGMMSIGQQQRVAFVRALCQPADFNLLDEPVSHIDEGNALIVAQMLTERVLSDGAGVIVTSIGYRPPYEYDHILRL